MSRDWNIVDDEIADPIDTTDETRLNQNRVRLITSERRSRERMRQWAIGFFLLAILAVSALTISAARWFSGSGDHAWAWTALGSGILAIAELLRRAIRAWRRPA